jgi:copper chaperone for superoxide dismutase
MKAGPANKRRGIGAAVCILETHSDKVQHDERVKGLARMVQVASNMTIIDLSIRGLSPGKYYATVREAGDISLGPESTGSVWESQREGPASKARGIWGTLDIGKDGMGSVFLDKPIQVWELIGRGVVVSRREDGPFDKEDADTLVGVVARSAGVWENDKTVCSCSGKTVWEERQDVVRQGML